MISLKELCEIIGGWGIPWANQTFAPEEEPEPPFICLVAGFSGKATADNAVWRDWMGYDIALYTRARDYTTEKTISEALTAADVLYDKTVTSLDSENLIETAFSVNVYEY